MSIPTDSKLVRLVLRVPTEMHEAIKHEAQQELMPLAVWTRAALIRELARRKAGHVWGAGVGMRISANSKQVRLVLRVPTEMHETIKNEARQELIPLSVWVRAVLLHVLARRKAEHGA